ncbi:zinc finger protein 436 [Drosophila tropicalis]|uniref:zinc finger protein 436 n=1 Tax=Drosophila tropicalis TaxID=46794 RepID=UPI0035ABDF1E
MKSKQKLRAPRAVGVAADAVTDVKETRRSSSIKRKRRKMLLCRACLVLLQPQDTSYDLFAIQDLARKFSACTGGKSNLMDIDGNQHEDVVLQCICECCYQLVQKFHDFQCMCEESLKNFQNLLKEVKEDGANKNEFEVEIEIENLLMVDEEEQKELPKAKAAELIEDIEEVYIIEDETAKDSLGKERISRKVVNTASASAQRKRGLRYTLDCHICGRGFYKSLLLEAHLKQHKGENPYTCVHCGKHFARSNLLDIHLRDVHQNPNERITYPCPKCNKVYSAERSLIYHFRRQHETKAKEEESPGHVCDKCGKSYGRKSHLTRHQWVHRKLEERRYCCINCDQRFYTKENMKDHMLRHHSKRNLLRCKKCGRLAGSRLDLISHMKRH